MRRTHGPNSGHPPGCFGCKVLDVQIAPSATPSRSNAAAINAREARMGKDIAAYKSLRADGLQPKQVTGSADLARHATHPLEVEMGRRLAPAAVEIAAEMAA
jgi:hypothetical protein